MPFGYVSPEQRYKELAEYARRGIARGRSVVVCTYADGIVFVAENPSKGLHKVSELYDRIGFAAVGRYNEFENLRVAGVRLADMRGYAYDRRDVTGRSLANAYAQTLGSIFAETPKPYEVEIIVAEVGDTAADDSIYRVMYDGSVADERGLVAMGGLAEPVAGHLREHHRDGMPLAEALGAAVRALADKGSDNGPRTLSSAELEVAVLDRTRPRRRFKRIVDGQLAALLAEAGVDAAQSETHGGDDQGDGQHATS